MTRKPVLGVAQALSARAMAKRYGTKLPVLLERRLLSTYRDIVVLNEFDQAEVRTSTPKTAVHLIRNSVAVPESLPSRNSATQPYGLFLGRIEIYQKGIDLLLAAHREAGAAALPLVIAGSGASSENRTLERLIAQAPTDVRWVGRVAGAEKDSLVRGAAYLVVTSREESFCLAALEAMSFAVPVIHFDLPQLSWIPDECGVRVRCFDIPALAGSLRDLSANTEARERLGSNARDFAVETSRTNQGAYRRLVEELLGAERVRAIRPGADPIRPRKMTDPEREF
ncbi:glycosyltransferase [Jatrophihabitans sp. GAS493]|uniref:glycosyltransferase n=1 Tax=Jatrophihabitans sp. GAS493 TaxID=1907575 RepID=UPI0012FD85C0|nr:glycosyltransferase [Jatrophihabitans sp. GAS493]